MNISTELWTATITCFAAIFTNNILLTYFLGMCPFTSVSREVKTSLGLGCAVIFVMTFTSGLNWAAYHYVLIPLELEFFRFILFIIIIAAFVQFVEMVIDRYSPKLYQNLGIFLPLFNSASGTAFSCISKVSADNKYLFISGRPFIFVCSYRGGYSKEYPTGSYRTERYSQNYIRQRFALAKRFG